MGEPRPTCRDFVRGRCRYGNDCRYLHPADSAAAEEYYKNEYGGRGYSGGDRDYRGSGGGYAGGYGREYKDVGYRDRFGRGGGGGGRGDRDRYVGDRFGERDERRDRFGYRGRYDEPPRDRYDYGGGGGGRYEDRYERDDRMRGAAAPRNSFKPGDWYCDECGGHNFARRANCFKCNAPRGAGEGRDRDRPRSRSRDRAGGHRREDGDRFERRSGRRGDDERSRARRRDSFRESRRSGDDERERDRERDRSRDASSRDQDRGRDRDGRDRGGGRDSDRRDRDRDADSRPNRVREDKVPIDDQAKAPAADSKQDLPLEDKRTEEPPKKGDQDLPENDGKAQAAQTKE